MSPVEGRAPVVCALPDRNPPDLARYQDPHVIRDLLQTAHTVAIVGLSSNPLRPSNFVGFYLQRHGYRIVPVNPNETEVLGERSYPSLLDIPFAVDIVDVFRRPAAVPAIAADAVEIRARALWLQFGVISAEGAAIAGPGWIAGGHGPLHEGRARAPHGPYALARLQHRRRHRPTLRAWKPSTRGAIAVTSVRDFSLTVLQSAVITAVVFVVLTLVWLAFVRISSDPTSIQLQRDGLSLARAQPWLVGLLFVWVTASLVLVERQRDAT